MGKRQPWTCKHHTRSWDEKRVAIQPVQGRGHQQLQLSHVCDDWLLAETSGRPGHGAGTDAVRDKSQSQKKQRQCSLSPNPRRHHQLVPATSRLYQQVGDSRASFQVDERTRNRWVGSSWVISPPKPRAIAQFHRCYNYCWRFCVSSTRGRSTSMSDLFTSYWWGMLDEWFSGEDARVPCEPASRRGDVALLAAGRVLTRLTHVFLTASDGILLDDLLAYVTPSDAAALLQGLESEGEFAEDLARVIFDIFDKYQLWVRPTRANLREQLLSLTWVELIVKPCYYCLQTMRGVP